MLDCQLFGLNPWGHHLTSLLLHALNAALVFLLFRRMTGALWRSLLVAALFAVDPLRVESVAWIAKRKDMLSAFFGLLTLMVYARYARDNESEIRNSKLCNYSLALLFFALGLMSKPMLVTWPFVMLLLDYWPLNRIRSSELGVRNLKVGDGKDSVLRAGNGGEHRDLCGAEARWRCDAVEASPAWRAHREMP